MHKTHAMMRLMHRYSSTTMYFYWQYRIKRTLNTTDREIVKSGCFNDWDCKSFSWRARYARRSRLRTCCGAGRSSGCAWTPTAWSGRRSGRRRVRIRPTTLHRWRLPKQSHVILRSDKHFNQPYLSHILLRGHDQFVIHDEFGLMLEQGTRGVNINVLTVDQRAVAFLGIFLGGVSEESGANGLLNSLDISAGADHVQFVSVHNTQQLFANVL